jgi:hypothetical protein
MKSKMSKFVSDRESPLSRLSQPGRNCNDCLVTIARNAGCCAIEMLALWDHRKRSLFLRDRFGVKPLYFFRSPGRFAFASELKAFLHLEGFDPANFSGRHPRQQGKDESDAERYIRNRNRALMEPTP